MLKHESTPLEEGKNREQKNGKQEYTSIFWKHKPLSQLNKKSYSTQKAVHYSARDTDSIALLQLPFKKHTR